MVPNEAMEKLEMSFSLWCREMMARKKSTGHSIVMRLKVTETHRQVVQGQENVKLF